MQIKQKKNERLSLKKNVLQIQQQSPILSGTIQIYLIIGLHNHDKKNLIDDYFLEIVIEIINYDYHNFQ